MSPRLQEALGRAVRAGNAPTDRASLTAMALLVYCQCGALAVPSHLQAVLQARQDRAWDRAAALQAVAVALRASSSSSPSSSRACCRELLLPMQPSLRTATCSDLLSLLERRGRSLDAQRDVHYGAGLACALASSVELVRGIVQDVLAVVPQLATQALAADDVWLLQVCD